MYKNGDKLAYGKFIYKKWGQVYINFMYKYGDKFTFIYKNMGTSLHTFYI